MLLKCVCVWYEVRLNSSISRERLQAGSIVRAGERRARENKEPHVVSACVVGRVIDRTIRVRRCNGTRAHYRTPALGGAITSVRVVQ